MTDSEVNLWMRIRGNQIGGHYFRRQVPIGNYVVDFVCVKARLIIEVDGSQHLNAVKLDEQRTAWLQSRGERGRGSGVVLAAEVGLLHLGVAA